MLSCVCVCDLAKYHHVRSAAWTRSGHVLSPTSSADAAQVLAIELAMDLLHGHIRCKCDSEDAFDSMLQRCLQFYPFAGGTARLKTRAMCLRNHACCLHFMLPRCFCFWRSVHRTVCSSAWMPQAPWQYGRVTPACACTMFTFQWTKATQLQLPVASSWLMQVSLRGRSLPCCTSIAPVVNLRE